MCALVAGAGGIFRRDISHRDFVQSFSLFDPDIVANQRSRWSTFLAAAMAGTILDKPAFNSPYPRTHLHLHPPIKDRLQSSYDDVNFELDLIRQFHRYSNIIFLGCDGLGYMRLIHRLAQDPQLYLMSTPIIIPQLGEHPHGTFHVLHGNWRVWWPFLETLAAVVGNKQVGAEPIVSHFNKYDHFMKIAIRACAEYVAEISATGLDFRNVPLFLSAADQNVSFSIVVYFLFTFGFLYLQMRNAVRCNESATLDKIWREFLSTAHTKDSNKTNYSQMSVIRVYWGRALVDELKQLYHNLRTMRLLHTHVGWDMFIEHVNLLIGESRADTWEQITSFLEHYNFTSVVNRGLEEVFGNGNKDSVWYKKIDKDVETIKEFLRTRIGATFAAATSQSDQNLMTLDLTRWCGTRVSKLKEHLPWLVARKQSKSNSTYVAQQLQKLCHWHVWV